MPDGFRLWNLLLRRLVHVALVGAGHEHCALGEARSLPRIAETPLGHRRVDLDMPAISNRPSTWVFSIPLAEPVQIAHQLASIQGADQRLRGIELLVGHGAPLAVPSPDHIGDHRTGVKQEIEIARGLWSVNARIKPSFNPKTCSIRTIGCGLVLPSPWFSESYYRDGRAQYPSSPAFRRDCP